MQELEPVERRRGLEREMEELDKDFDRYMSGLERPRVYRELPQPTSVDETFMVELNAQLRYLNWMTEGPDDYDTIDDTITSTQESRYNYDPYILWSVNVLNNAAAGGPNVLLRFTDSYGRIKQYKVVPGADFSLKDIRGSMGNVFRVVTDTGPAEMIGWIGLKWRLGQKPVTALADVH